MKSGGRSERPVTWSRLSGLSRRADSAWWTAVGWSGARGCSRARQDGQHVAPVRGRSAGETKRGKAATCARPFTIKCAASGPGFCGLESEAATSGPVGVHARVRRFPRKSAARLLDHMPGEGWGRGGHRAVSETGKYPSERIAG